MCVCQVWPSKIDKLCLEFVMVPENDWPEEVKYKRDMSLLKCIGGSVQLQFLKMTSKDIQSQHYGCYSLWIKMSS